MLWLIHKKSVFPWVVLFLLPSACDQGGGGGSQRKPRSEVSTSQKGKDPPASSTQEGQSNPAESSPGSSVFTNDLETESAPRTQGAFVSRTLTFGSDSGGNLKGYYLAPEGLTSMGPGVVLIHGVTGLSPAFKKNMERFAEKGYRVFAPDLFSGQVPATKNEGTELMADLTRRGRQEIIALISAAGQYMFDKVKVTAVGLVGWDQGGFWSVATVLTFKNQFSALVNYYGSPFELNKQISEISSPILNVFVQDDQEIDITEVIALEKKLATESPKPVTFHKFQGVEPDFMDPSLSEGQKDQDNIALAYKFTFDFLDSQLKGP